MGDVYSFTSGYSWEERKLNSFMKKLQEGRDYIGGDKSNVAFYLARDFTEVHSKSKKKTQIMIPFPKY